MSNAQKHEHTQALLPIKVTGARVNNLKNIDVTIPQNKIVAIAGVSGSGKSSLALGVLYSEGARRYIEALSTYTRRRISQNPRANVESVQHIPAALALRQRPGVPDVRSTFGTSTELLNVLRLMFSRLGSHLCPNGHRLPPTIDVAADIPLTCPVCNAVFSPQGAEDLSFNAAGACPTCSGTGQVNDINESAIVPDESKSIVEGAVLPWSMLGATLMPQIVAEFGVRIDVPYRELTAHERQIVMDGPAEKKLISAPSKNGKLYDLNFTYRNARLCVREALEKATTDRGLDRPRKFVTEQQCRHCNGSRLSEKAREPEISGINLAQAAAKTLDELLLWAPGVVRELPPDMHQMAKNLVDKLEEMAIRLVQLGLGYLSLDRASLTLSTGERQRIQLARAVRNQTTGVLYVLDEPSIGLHPSNVEGLLGVIFDLIKDGNSIVLVDHDVQVLREADWMIEIGPGSGAEGGSVIATGTVPDIINNPKSLLGGFLSGENPVVVRKRTPSDEIFAKGAIRLQTHPIHTVRSLNTLIPKGQLTAVTGVSGSGKTTLILESLVPAIRASINKEPLPGHVAAIDIAGITRITIVDATPIGNNVRSTVATYSGIMDELRKVYAATADAKKYKLKAAAFSYNTGDLRCPRCEGTGQIVLDIQFLPDVNINCPDCNGSRFAPLANEIRRPVSGRKDIEGISLPSLLGLTVNQAIEVLNDVPKVCAKLQILTDLGLGYLTLGEDTTALSGGEAQRLKLASELDRTQSDSVFVFDEPSVGLHPLDIRTLLKVIQRLIDNSATVVVIEHDPDMIANSDYIIDMGPGGGAKGGTIVATGAPGTVMNNSSSITGKYLSTHIQSINKI